MISEVSSSLNPFVLNAHRYLVARMYPAEGAFVGSDLSGEVVKLGPNLQKDIKIGDVVGASVVGGTFPVSPSRAPLPGSEKKGN